MVRKREKFWISGLDFFEYCDEPDNSNLTLLMQMMNLESLPAQLTEYLLKMRPIDPTGHQFFKMNVDVRQHCKHILDTSVVINPNFDSFFLPLFNLREIIEEIERNDFFKSFTSKMMIPIGRSIPEGNIVLSLEKGWSYGKLFYVVDYYDFEISEKFLFTHCLFDFLTGLRQVPFRYNLE